MIKTILFDLDDTLLDFHKSERAALEKTLRRLGIVPKEELLTRYSAINLAQWKLLEQEKITLPTLKVRRYQLLFEEFGISCSAEKAVEYYEAQLGMECDFVEGAKEVVKTLSGMYQLVIVSNGTAEVQRSRIKRAGLEPYLSGVFISQEIGYYKPHPAFFHCCFAQINGFCKAEAVLVGDSLSSDIKGGNGVGIKTIWYNPEGLENKSDIQPEFEIRTLSELVPLLKCL